MDSRIHNVAQPLYGTCTWFVEHQSFKQWWDKGETFLWLRGKAGSGKSTIMKEALAWAEKCGGSRTILSYFFNARSPHELEKSCLGLYRALTYQLLNALPGIRNSFERHFLHKTDSVWTEVEIQNFWMQLILDKNLTQVVIFVDALDEGADDDVRAMINFFIRLSRWSTDTGSITICLSSRPYPNITIRNSALVIVEDQPGHDHDIKSYIEDQLEGDESSQLKHVQQAVYEKSSGVFLWVVLVVARLNKAYDQGQNVYAMMEELKVVPLALLELIFNIFTQDADQEVLAQRQEMMMWVLYSLEDMGAVALRSAVDTTFKPLLVLAATAEEHAAESRQAKRWVIDISCGLVEVVQRKTHGTAVVQLIHESVRDLLLKPGQTETGCDSTGRTVPKFDAIESHARIATKCLQHLMPEPLHTDHPLAYYPIHCWSRHVRLCHLLLTNDVLKKVLDFISDNEHFSIWLYHALKFSDESRPVFGVFEAHAYYRINAALQSTAKVPAMFVATCLNWENVMEALILKGADANLTVEHQKSLLCIAAEFGYVGVVKILLESGADPNTRPDDYGYALHTAARAGHDEVVRILLSAGADVNTYSDLYRTAQYIAALEGYGEVVRILLSAGTDVNTYSDRFRTALYTAVLDGKIEVVRILLSAGADVNVHSDRFRTALYTAVLDGKIEVVRILLSTDADVNTYSDRFRTALYTAVLDGNIEVVRILLAAGADVNAHHVTWGTALQVACEISTAHLEIVQCLIQAGADINATGGVRGTGTALQLALSGQHFELAGYLLDHGADPNLTSAAPDEVPLHAVVAYGNEDLVQKILDAGARVDVRCRLPSNYIPSSYGVPSEPQTALELAQLCQKWRIADILRGKSRGLKTS